MSELMYDSIDATGIPGSAAVVAGYGDGKYLWPSSWWDLFPAAVHLVIVVSAAHAGDVLDVEDGDATPAEVPGWVRRFNRPSRRRPTIYCNRVTWPRVVAALEAAGLSAAAVDWWAATLDGTQDVAGAVAVQYEDLGPYDVSVIHDPTWAGGHMVPTSQLGDDLLVLVHHLTQFWCFGPVDPTGQQDFVNTVRAGVGVNTIADGWMTLPQAQAWQAAIARLVADDEKLTHLQTGAPGVDPVQLQASLAQLAKDVQQVLVDLQAAAGNQAL